MNTKCIVDNIGNLCFNVEFQKDLLIAGITSLISVLAVIVSNCITLHINNKNLKCTKQQFKQQIELQTKQFSQTVQRDNEYNRISIMPYFELNESMTIINEDGIIKFPLIFTNIGNGTAKRTFVEIQNLLVYEDTTFKIQYGQCQPMSATVVKVEKCTETMIKAECKEGAYKVILNLCFEDMMNREYKQKFSFYYEANRDNKILVDTHSGPECLKYNI